MVQKKDIEKKNCKVTVLLDQDNLWTERSSHMLTCIDGGNVILDYF